MIQIKDKCEASIGILINKENKILITSVPEKKILLKKGKWEFPGGKLEKLETPENALYRELNEELGIEILKFKEINTFLYEDSSITCLIKTYLIQEYNGTPQGIEGQELRWTRFNELSTNYPTLIESHKMILGLINQLVV